MTTYILTGDILHAGRVAVEADNLTDAIAKAEAGDFTEVVDEDGKSLGFVLCGDLDGGAEAEE